MYFLDLPRFFRLLTRGHRGSSRAFAKEMRRNLMPVLPARTTCMRHPSRAGVGPPDSEFGFADRVFQALSGALILPVLELRRYRDNGGFRNEPWTDVPLN